MEWKALILRASWRTAPWPTGMRSALCMAVVLPMLKWRIERGHVCCIGVPLFTSIRRSTSKKHSSTNTLLCANNIKIRRPWTKPRSVTLQYNLCRAPLFEECPQHHGHKGDPGVTPGTCGTIGERTQVILVWVRAPRRWERLPPMETRSHEGKALSIGWLMAL